METPFILFVLVLIIANINLVAKNHRQSKMILAQQKIINEFRELEV